jgi:hypothetical protein
MDYTKKHRENTYSLLMERWGFKAPKNKEISHLCAMLVTEKTTGKVGHPINHTLLEGGAVTHYDVEFDDVIIEGMPVAALDVEVQEEHMHGRREDYAHDEEKPRTQYTEVVYEEEEEGGFITFSDGYKFKEVSKSFAASNWDKVEVYGIDISSESESLIDSVDDLNQPWDAFGIEAGGSLEEIEVEDLEGADDAEDAGQQPSDKMSAGDFKTKSMDQAKMGSESGMDPKENAIISQLVDILKVAAKEGNITSGNINTLLNKLADEAKKIS